MIVSGERLDRADGVVGGVGDQAVDPECEQMPRLGEGVAQVTW
jgi:hypothetical protein